MKHRFLKPKFDAKKLVEDEGLSILHEFGPYVLAEDSEHRSYMVGSKVLKLFGHGDKDELEIGDNSIFIVPLLSLLVDERGLPESISDAFEIDNIKQPEEVHPDHIVTLVDVGGFRYVFDNPVEASSFLNEIFQLQYNISYNYTKTKMEDGLAEEETDNILKEIVRFL